MSGKEYIFWTEDPTILYSDNNYLDFFPNHFMNRTQKLNAVTRFAIYLGAFFIITNKNSSYLYLPLGIIFVSLIMYYINSMDTNKKEKQLEKLIEKKNERLTEQKVFEKQLIPDDETDTFSEKNTEEEKKSFEVEVGQIDANGNLTFAKNNDSAHPNNMEIYSTEEIIKANKHQCRRPSVDNPFMNPLTNDFGTENVPQACNVEDEEIKNEAVNFFNEDLYRDLDDLWDKKNSQRQWYTLPSTKVPNDQINFAKWCYSMPATCKENQTNCLRYEDLRQKR